MVGTARARTAAAAKRGQEWVERQEPSSRPGVAIDAWRRYKAVDGPLQSALLSLYMVVAVVPALMVMEEYLDSHPAALAHHLIRHYHLNKSTGALLQGVLTNTHKHELGSALLAIGGALIFGLGFGRVLQLVHSRAWNVTVPARLSDQGLYAGVLLGVYGFILVLLVQLTELRGSASWIGSLLYVGWAGLLVLFFTWAPWLMLHKQISRRDLLPAAVLTAVGLIVIGVISSFVLEFWINLYARDYGGLGVVLAMYFWLAFSSAVIVWSASLAPALAQRRNLLLRS